jgi:hypothetical protein
MAKKIQMRHVCRCGKPGTYRYSYQLAKWLKLHPWEGIVLCDECMRRVEEEAKGASNEECT